MDFIKIRLPASIQDAQSAAAFTKRIEGRLKFPKRYRDARDEWITIHDPTGQDLQYLLDEHHDTEILAIEIAVDFALKDGSNDPARLLMLHHWFKTTLFPQRHECMRRVGRRKFYDSSDNTIKPDTLKTRSGEWSIYWANTSGFEQVRLYIKTSDNGAQIQRHFVRLEVTLNRGGCQLAKVHRIGLLPAFVHGMRRYLSPFLIVAKGIKPKVKRSRSKNLVKTIKATETAAKERARAEVNWNRYGAAWAAKHDYGTIPDTHANRLIGKALKSLRDALKRSLIAPKKVAESAAPNIEQSSIHQ